jgi:hypothetical protein
VPDLTDRLDEICVPVLLIWAVRDVLSPISVGRTLEARLRRASLVTFDSDDHWVARQFSPTSRPPFTRLSNASHHDGLMVTTASSAARTSNDREKAKR